MVVAVTGSEGPPGVARLATAGPIADDPLSIARGIWTDERRPEWATASAVNASRLLASRRAAVCCLETFVVLEKKPDGARRLAADARRTTRWEGRPIVREATLHDLSLRSGCGR